MTEWALFFLCAGIITAAAAFGIVELHWTKIPQPGPVLARWLRAISAQLDSPPSRILTKAILAPASTSSPPVNVSSNSTKVEYRGSETGWYRVLTADELFQCLDATQVIRRIAKASRLSPSVFERDLLPAIRNYAEFVQLMPASESHHHANPGGLLAHTLETVLHAATFRAGWLLPQGQGAEVIAAERDYWTYAVILGALLHDAGKPISDLQIRMRRSSNSEPVIWTPFAGSLNNCQAMQYHVGFKVKAERNYASHSKLGITLLQRFVPAAALTNLSQAPSVLMELNSYLSGDNGSCPIAEIVKKADQESVRRNLSGGSRARFETARSIPLIERMMHAMKSMLDQGGHLPLNRDGAAGWVFDDSVWFVAKRLADTVREHIIKHADADDPGIPNQEKNDRLFDTWQEYDIVRVNPDTQQAIWHVIVKGHTTDGQEAYEHTLSVLRFPLEKLWNHPENYPKPMNGTIEVTAKQQRTKLVPETRDQVANNNLPHEAHSNAQVSEGNNKPTSAARSQVPPDASKVPAPKFSALSSKRTRSILESDDLLEEADTAKAEARAAKQVKEARQKVTEEKARQTNDRNADGAPQGTPGEGVHSPGGAVHLSPDRPPTVSPSKKKDPSPLAIRFMQWVQAGLAGGTIKYNEAGAHVHFIEFGIALVSPLIFKQFSGVVMDTSGIPNGQSIDDFAMEAQRELVKAQWHLPAPGGKNVWSLFVVKKGAASASRLAAIVLKDPHSWVKPVPPPNPYISVTDPLKAPRDSDKVAT